MRLPLIGLLLAALPCAAAEHPLAGDVLRLQDPADARRRQVEFRAVHDPALARPLVADPRAAGATLELFGNGPGDGATGPITLASVGWRGLGRPPGTTGFVFRSRTGAAGVRRVVLRTGRHGGTLVVSGRGAGCPYRIAQPQGPIDVRLTVGGEVYCARFAAYARNEPGHVLGRHAAAPPDCAGGPGPVCGDGVVSGAEECDDRNTVGGDGCSATCRLEDARALCAGIATASGATLHLVPVATGLVKPTHVTAAALDPSRVFVVEQPGRIRVVENGVLLPEPFLAIESLVGFGGERGLLSVAFHPRYAANGRFFVYYTDPTGDIVIARYQVGSSPQMADASSAHVLLTISHQTFMNHNGGQLAFGPDGYLYAGTGDGGGGGDPAGNAQDTAVLLGKLLRLDVDVDTPPYHTVPPTNPFVGAGTARPEIWALGLRNPWRFGFDRATGDLYVADVGQDTWEEVDVQPAGSAGGKNYGWNVFEGGHCFNPPSGCVDGGFTMPALEYNHDQGPGSEACSITGGLVYRGCRMPDLHGTYFYADFCRGFVRTFRGVHNGMAQDPGDRTAELGADRGGAVRNVSSFGEDARGELYVVTQSDPTGQLLRIEPGS